MSAIRGRRACCAESVINSSRDLVVVGAGGLGREIAAIAPEHPDYGVKWSLRGFIDDDQRALDPFASAGTVLGRISDYVPSKRDIFVVGIGDPVARDRCSRLLMERGGEFMTFIHPTVALRREVRIGAGAVLLSRVNLTCDITVGEFTVFLSYSGAGHDVQVGRCCQISSFVDLMGGAVLEDFVTIGSGARVLPGVRVGRGALVGAGSVAVKNVAPLASVFGVPARVVGYRPPVAFEL